MYQIENISSIGHQATFKADNIWDILSDLDEDSELIKPNYKDYISAGQLRRMSPILRMAMTTVKECQANTNTEFEAITVGTSLGCLTDTEKFLKSYINSQGGILSPTSFIQSTHNTISGLISLELKNHSYNMTHTQNGVSFEMALIDAMMCCDEGKKNVLTGAADESIEFLNELKPALINTSLDATSGSTFLVLNSNDNPKNISVEACKVYFNENEVEDNLRDFLNDNKITLSDIDTIFHAGDFQNDRVRTVNYLRYSGLYYTASAFAFHMAHDWLLKNNSKFSIVLNTQSDNGIGITLLKNYAA